MHTRNHQPAPALCASVALVAANPTLANLAANAMFARALLDDHTGEPPTMRTHHVLLAGNDLPHHLLAAMLHQPGRNLVLVDSTFDNGAMTLPDSDDPGRDPTSMLMTDLLHEHNFGDLHHDHGRDATMLTIGGRHKHLGLGAMMIGDLHHHPDIDPSAMMASTVHNDQGALDLNDSGGSIGSELGEHRMNGNRHPHDLQTDRRRLNQPKNRGRHHDADDLPVMMCIGADDQHHVTPPDARLLN